MSVAAPAAASAGEALVKEMERRREVLRLVMRLLASDKSELLNEIVDVFYKQCIK